MLACAQITIRDAMDELYASAIAPEDPAMDQLWLDTSASPSVLKRWTGTAWETVNDTAPLVERILRAEQRVTDEAILATVTESEAYQGLETRLSSAEQQITSDAILATVRSSAEYRSDVYGERNFVLLSHLHATFIDNRYVNASGTATQYAQIGFTLSEDLYAASGQGKNLYISFDIKRTNVVATADNIYSGVWINYSYWGENWDTVTSNWGWYLRDTDSDFQATDSDWVHIKKGPMDLDKRNALSLIYLVFGGEAADGTTGKIELRNPKVEVAGFSDWTRAPEDLADMPERLSSAESKIEQHSDEISLKVSQTTYDSEKIYRSATAPANPTMGMLWLDTGATPNLLKRCTLADADGWVMWDIVGAREVSASGVYIGPDTVRIDTPNFTVTVPGAGEQLQIDGEGVVAQTITSPSIVQQYTGSSTAYVRTDAAPDGKQYFRSLEDIFSVVRGKYVSQLTVYLMSSGTLSIGDLVVQQIHGRIRIYNMANMILAGSLSFTRCDSVELSGIVLHSSHSIGISVSDCYAFECADGKIYGPGAGIGINLGRHVNASIMNTEIRGYSSAVSANYSCVLFTKNLSGTGAISALGCCLMANGTVPSGGARAMENAGVQQRFQRIWRQRNDAGDSSAADGTLQRDGDADVSEQPLGKREWPAAGVYGGKWAALRMHLVRQRDIARKSLWQNDRFGNAYHTANRWIWTGRGGERVLARADQRERVGYAVAFWELWAAGSHGADKRAHVYPAGGNCDRVAQRQHTGLLPVYRRNVNDKRGGV